MIKGSIARVVAVPQQSASARFITNRNRFDRGQLAGAIRQRIGSNTPYRIPAPIHAGPTPGVVSPATPTTRFLSNIWGRTAATSGPPRPNPFLTPRKHAPNALRQLAASHPPARPGGLRRFVQGAIAYTRANPPVDTPANTGAGLPSGAGTDQNPIAIPGVEVTASKLPAWALPAAAALVLVLLLVRR